MRRPHGRTRIARGYRRVHCREVIATLGYVRRDELGDERVVVTD